jgi:superoxide dismutase
MGGIGDSDSFLRIEVVAVILFAPDSSSTMTGNNDKDYGQAKRKRRESESKRTRIIEQIALLFHVNLKKINVKFGSVEQMITQMNQVNAFGVIAIELTLLNLRQFNTFLASKCLSPTTINNMKSDWDAFLSLESNNSIRKMYKQLLSTLFNWANQVVKLDSTNNSQSTTISSVGNAERGNSGALSNKHHHHHHQKGSQSSHGNKTASTGNFNSGTIASGIGKNQNIILYFYSLLDEQFDQLHLNPQQLLSWNSIVG